MAADPDTGEPRHIHPFEYMAQTSDPDLLAAVARVAARADVAATAESRRRGPPRARRSDRIVIPRR